MSRAQQSGWASPNIWGTVEIVGDPPLRFVGRNGQAAIAALVSADGVHSLRVVASARCQTTTTVGTVPLYSPGFELLDEGGYIVILRGRHERRTHRTQVQAAPGR